ALAPFRYGRRFLLSSANATRLAKAAALWSFSSGTRLVPCAAGEAGGAGGPREGGGGGGGGTAAGDPRRPAQVPRPRGGGGAPQGGGGAAAAGPHGRATGRGPSSRARRTPRRDRR